MTFKLLYAVIVLSHHRRRIIHFEVTQNPTQAWLARQIIEALHLAICYETEIRRMVFASKIVSGRWELRRS